MVLLMFNSPPIINNVDIDMFPATDDLCDRLDCSKCSQESCSLHANPVLVPQILQEESNQRYSDHCRHPSFVPFANINLFDTVTQFYIKDEISDEITT